MILQDQRGNYFTPNWEAIKQVCHSFAHAAGTLRNCSIVRDRNTYFAGATEHAYVKFNKEALRRHVLVHGAGIYSREFYDGMMLQRCGDFNEKVQRLADLRRQARRYNQIVQRDVFGEVDRINRHSFDTIDSQIGWSQSIRDWSATALVIGAGMLSGGMAVAALGTGATIKGTAKIADAKVVDGGVIGQALVEVACEMTVGALGMGMGTATLGQKVLVAVFVQAPLEVCKTVVGGGDLKQGAAVGATEVALNVVGHGVEKAVPIKAIAKKVSVDEDVVEYAVGATMGIGGDKAKNTAGELAKTPKADPQKASVVRSSNNLAKVTGAFLNHGDEDEAFVRKHCIVAKT